MIKRFLNKIPAGMMVIPLLLGSVLATLCPQVLEIGGLTTALFSSAAAYCCSQNLPLAQLLAYLSARYSATPASWVSLPSPSYLPSRIPTDPYSSRW